MRALIQRVSSARVRVENEIISEIGPGILTLLGVATTDTEAHAKKIIQKILKLRIFEDEAGKMNLSLLDKKYEHLIVSQFTLFGDASQGNRPSFIDAARPELAKSLYEKAVFFSRAEKVKTETGKFQADMKIELINDGPVTLWIEV